MPLTKFDIALYIVFPLVSYPVSKFADISLVIACQLFTAFFHYTTKRSHFDKLQVHHSIAIQFKARDLVFRITRDMKVVHPPKIVDEVVVSIQHKGRIVIFCIAEE